MKRELRLAIWLTGFVGTIGALFAVMAWLVVAGLEHDEQRILRQAID